MMTEERDQLRAAVRAVAARHVGIREHMAARQHDEHDPAAPTIEEYDAATWNALASGVGAGGLLVADELGGSGGTIGDAAVVFEETASVLLPVPLLSTVGLATSMLIACGDAPEADRLATRLADSAQVATVAFLEPGSGWFDSPSATVAETDGESWRLTGTKTAVVDVTAADFLLVTAATPQGVAVFSVESGEDGAEPERRQSLDLGRDLGVLELKNAPATLIQSGEKAESAIALGFDLAVTLLAAEQVGAAQKCLDGAVAYAKQREQFDRKIGSFQAIKHTLVQALLEVEFARSTAGAAATAGDQWLARRDEPSRRALRSAAATAKSVCSDAFMYVAEETLHVFGGVGFTWEHDAHLYYRRAKFCELFLGTPEEHRERLARTAGLGERSR
ncbi:acyl-CoA dehydrogenase (plasmid) [Rhodococcus opacus]|uniref:Acyl-CoA dehydrogenase n=2 Tax=Rhodococcus opacus TaxID=37919 RepID=A0A076EYR4_RHOOP|nr:acyl-CoA dehydrogenase [Rhodococcus opacus]